MKLKKETIETYISLVEIALPGLVEVLTTKANRTLLIGAGVFDLYALNGWTAELNRETKDLDFAIEFITDDKVYKEICGELLKLGYSLDPIHPYRFHSPNKKKKYGYIDLLTFTLDKNLEGSAQSAMKVGEDFSFKGMAFALNNSILLKDNIYLPNPLGMIYLKMSSYLNEPKRLKDFGDICEMVVGLVLKQTSISDLREIALKYHGTEEMTAIVKMLIGIIKDNSPVWDYDVVEMELLSRESLSNLRREDLAFYFEKFKLELNL